MKKVVLLFILFSSLFLMTGCGASVTSKTKFSQDGSGNRTISAVISAKDGSNLDGGFSELDKLLEDAAPDGISINRTMRENGDAVYEFIFHFDNIEQYNQKIYEITGKPHNATWYSNPSIFLSNIEFKEEDCTYDLVSWAIDAFKNSKYAKFSSYFTLYEVTKNEVYYNDALVYSGTGDPNFTVEISPKVKKASMYSTYNYDGTREKRIEIQFEPGNLEVVNVEDVKKMLLGYSNDYKIDLANDLITYTLRNEEINQFLLSADLSNTEETLLYNSVYNPFQKKFEIQERFSLKEFFSQFNMEYAYIFHYIKLPEVLPNLHVSHTNELTDVEVVDGYDFAGAFRYDTNYSMAFSANQMVDLTKIHVFYSVDKELESTRHIQMEYSKNGCDITEKEIRKYYPNLVDTISVSDDETTIKVNFKIKVKEDSEKKLPDNPFAMDRLPRRNLKDIRYELVDDLMIRSYLPQLDGYTWDVDAMKYDYEIRVDITTGITSLSVNGVEYGFGDSDKRLENCKEDDQYVVTGQSKVVDPIKVSVTFTQMYDLYYFWIIAILFIVVIAILAVVLVKMGKQRQALDQANREDTTEK